MVVCLAERCERVPPAGKLTMDLFTWERITFWKTFRNVIRPFRDFSPCERKAVSNQAFETRKKGILDRDPRRKPDSRTCERKDLSERDSCVCILKMCAEAMHKRMGQSARADCAVGAKYYLAVCRSWSWLGRHLQCMWTHVVQITIPITFLDRDPKRLSERSCEHSHCEHFACSQQKDMYNKTPTI